MGRENDGRREPSARIRAKRASVIDSEIEEEGDAGAEESEESEDSDDREFIDDGEVEEGDLTRICMLNSALVKGQATSKEDWKICKRPERRM